MLHKVQAWRPICTGACRERVQSRVQLYYRRPLADSLRLYSQSDSRIHNRLR